MWQKRELLLRKFNVYELRGVTLDILNDYLFGRSQVIMDGYRSESRNVTSGVPQGSTLSTLLFFDIRQ